jgi:hypothetical protein
VSPRKNVCIINWIVEAKLHPPNHELFKWIVEAKLHPPNHELCLQPCSKLGFYFLKHEHAEVPYISRSPCNFLHGNSLVINLLPYTFRVRLSGLLPRLREPFLAEPCKRPRRMDSQRERQRAVSAQGSQKSWLPRLRLHRLPNAHGVRRNYHQNAIARRGRCSASARVWDSTTAGAQSTTARRRAGGRGDGATESWRAGRRRAGGVQC